MATPATFVDQAKLAAKNAVDYEGKSQYRAAIEEYKHAIKLLQTAIKYEQFDKLQQTYRQKIVEYLTRAEQLQKYVQEAENPPSPQSGGTGQKEKPKQAGDKSDDSEDKGLKDAIAGSIIQEKPNVHWTDVAGLESAKAALQEAVILPIRFPELFVGKRTPWRGILLFGPPGTGKSFIAKAVATEAQSTFFSISSSDLMSKWVGQSERLIKALFQLARDKRPSIVFIDELDSIAGQRSDNENESSRRVKTELLIQLQGVGNNNDKILFLGATNTPWSLDSAVIRRFDRRILIPLPEAPAREQLFRLHLGTTPHSLTNDDFRELGRTTEGFSGSDISVVVKGALMEPVRQLQVATHFKQIQVPGPDGKPQIKWTGCSPGDPDPTKKEMTLMQVPANQLYSPPVTMEHMLHALATSKSSVSKEDVEQCNKWAAEFGAS